MSETAFQKALRAAEIRARKAERKWERALENGTANSMYPSRMDEPTQELWEETCKTMLYPSEMKAIREGTHEEFLNQRAYESFLKKEHNNQEHVQSVLHEYGYQRHKLGADIRKFEHDLPGTASNYSVVGGDLDGII